MLIRENNLRKPLSAHTRPSPAAWCGELARLSTENDSNPAEPLFGFGRVAICESSSKLTELAAFVYYSIANIQFKNS